MKTIIIASWMATLIVASSANAWNGKGHMMVAAVDYNKLTEQAKNRVGTLLLLNTDLGRSHQERPRLLTRTEANCIGGTALSKILNEELR